MLGREGEMGGQRPNHVLMLYPRFVADTFWSFAGSCKLMGARRTNAAVGQVEVAGGRGVVHGGDAAEASRHAASDRAFPRVRQAGGGGRPGRHVEPTCL